MIEQPTADEADTRSMLIEVDGDHLHLAWPVNGGRLALFVAPELAFWCFDGRHVWDAPIGRA